MLTNKLIERFEEAVRAHEALLRKQWNRIHVGGKEVEDYLAAKAALKAEIRRVRRPAWLPPTVAPGSGEVGCV